MEFGRDIMDEITIHLIAFASAAGNSKRDRRMHSGIFKLGEHLRPSISHQLDDGVSFHAVDFESESSILG